MFFFPPPILETHLFAELPPEFRRLKEPNAWMSAQRLNRTTTLEGPSFDRDGNIHCVDIPNGRVFRIDGNGQFDLVADYDGWPNGLKFHADGRIFITDFRFGLMILDPVTGKVEPLLTEAGGKPFKGLNDLFFAANGDLYFTDQGMTGLHDPTGRVFRLSASGVLTLLLDNVPSPNGLVMNLEESVLYVAATRGNCIWRVPLDDDGLPSKVGNFVQLSGSRGGPDGLALDVEGNLLICHSGLGVIWLVDELGEPRLRITSCAGRHMTNLAFGGEDRCTLFITEAESGSILTARLPKPGKRMFSGF